MPDIFLSYARQDIDQARSLFGTLAMAGFDVWMDKKYVGPGYDWKLEIEKAIRNSRIFLACLSNMSVQKKAFVQAEIRRAYEVLEELPEGGVYLIPIRFDDCPIPQKLQHLHCVDAFEEGAIEHLISFLTTRLRESVYRQTAAQDRGQRLRGFLTGASQNVLRFVVIRLDGSDINWAEFPLPKKPVLFGQKYNQFFKLVEFVSDADPIFDITVKNELQTPIILTELGVQLVFGAHEEYVYGFPGTAKIKVADAYAIEIPEIKEYWDKYRRKIPSDNRGNRPFILKLQKEVVLQLPDLIQFEGHAVYRYSLRLKNYTQHVPNLTLIRFTAESDRGRVQSHLVRMFTL